MTENKNYLAKLAIVLLAMCMLLLVGCGDSIEIPSDSIVTGDIESAEGYYYGIVSSGGTYYARVLSEYTETPSDGDYMYIALADKAYASFMENGVDGASSPLEYNSAEELANADKDGKITVGAKVYYSVSNGLMEYLAEYSYREIGGVDLTNGELIE